MIHVLFGIFGGLWTLWGVYLAVQTYPDGPTPEVMLLMAACVAALGLYFKEDS